MSGGTGGGGREAKSILYIQWVRGLDREISGPGKKKEKRGVTWSKKKDSERKGVRGNTMGIKRENHRELRSPRLVWELKFERKYRQEEIYANKDSSKGGEQEKL